MNPVNTKKLMHSKWTVVAPLDREKHFLVTDVQCDEDGRPKMCVLEAVHSRREIEIAWRDLKDTRMWQIGWK